MNMNTPLEYGPCFMIVAGNPGMAQKHGTNSKNCHFFSSTKRFNFWWSMNLKSCPCHFRKNTFAND